jgi:hypothetical protein
VLEFVSSCNRPVVGSRERLANDPSDFMPEVGVKGGEIAMNPEQIKDEIRKLNWIDKIGIYRWINQEVAGYRDIGTDRSFQIRQEIERYARFPVLESVLQEQNPSNARRSVAPKESGSGS